MAGERKYMAGAAQATALSANITTTNDGITITVDDDTGWPTGTTYPHVMVIAPGTASEEKVLVKRTASNQFTVETGGRGYDGTTAATHSAGDVVEHRLDADTITRLLQHAFGDLLGDHDSEYRRQDVDIVSGDITSLASSKLTGLVSNLDPAVAFGLVPIGGMVEYAGTASPDTDYWLLCDGAAVSRTTYATLFGVVGTTFGVGDGSTTFNVPDRRGRVGVGLDNMGGTSADRITDTQADALGGVFGAEDVALTEAQMPSHTHAGPSHTHAFSATSSSSGSHTHSIDHNHASATTSSSGAHTHGPAGGHSNFIMAGAGSTVFGDGGTAQGSTFGSQSATASNGAHTHTLDLPNFTGSSGSGGSHNHSVSGTTDAGGTGATGSAGSGAAHPNVQPSIALGYLIRAA